MGTDVNDAGIVKAIESVNAIRKQLQEYKDHADNLIELAAIVDLEESCMDIVSGLQQPGTRGMCVARVKSIDGGGDLEIEFRGRAASDAGYAGHVLGRLSVLTRDSEWVIEQARPVIQREREEIEFMDKQAKNLRM
jgi:hypothetical protein